MGVNSPRLHLYACLIELSIIPVISTQFEVGVKFYPSRSNLTRHKILVKMGVNSPRLHCMPPWLNWVSSQWIQLASISMDLLPIQLVKFDQAWNTGKNGCKFTEITFVCLPNRIGHHLSDFYPIWGGVKFYPPQSNLTRHEILVKMGVNSLRLCCMPPWSNWASSQWIQLAFKWIYSQFDQAWNTGKNGCKFTESTFVCQPNRIGYHPSDFHPIWKVGQILSPPPIKFDQAWNTCQNGCKFTEITLYASLVKSGIIPMNSTGIYLNGFTPNSTGH